MPERAQTVSPISEKRGGSFSTFAGYAVAVKRALGEWDSSRAVVPKNLRNTLQSAAIDAGWDSYTLQRYVGHAPATVSQKHYHDDNPERLLRLFREQVIPQIESEVQAWAKGREAVFFGLTLARQGTTGKNA